LWPIGVGSIDSDEQADKISVDKKKCKATVEFLQNQSFMKITLVTLTLILGLLTFAKGQANTDKPSTTSTWTDADRKYLLDNLIRSKEEIIAETKSLTKEQWNFKESPDRWSINQIIEHICFWELIQMNEISVALRMGPLPQIPQNPDSIFIDADPKRINKNITTDYTKPFTYSVPLGNNEGKNNIIWYTKMRDESIEYLKSTNDNLRLYRVNFGPQYSSALHDVLSTLVSAFGTDTRSEKTSQVSKIVYNERIKEITKPKTLKELLTFTDETQLATTKCIINGGVQCKFVV
jgi:hypothetical protein